MLRITLALLFLCCSCTLMFGGKSAQKSDRIQAALQDTMQQTLVDKGYDEAWGMFSESGYADRGQVIVYYKKPQNFGTAYIYDSGSQTVSRKVIVEKQAWADFKETVSQDEHIPDYKHKSFDGIRYQYLHYIKKAGKVSLKEEISMINPGESKDSPMHTNFVKQFYKLAR